MKPISRIVLIVLFSCTLGCQIRSAEANGTENKSAASQPAQEKGSQEIVFDPAKDGVAILAGGCFWCTEAAMEKLPGVLSAVSGYTGGTVKNPTYGDVAAGQTDQLEAVLVTFDPKKISYAEILDAYWRSIDPTQENGQFADRGDHYKTAIFYLNDSQRKIAESSKQKMDDSKKFNRPIVTKVLSANSFWRAEDNHQDYYKKHPFKYRRYFIGSGRKRFLEKTWGPEKKPTK